ncbi:hypothetical protein MARA_51260 [Mycolicibacterium arabiense]|uniref:Keratin associated protein n=1 Tax=Mycolicibacterium arabiense TaxID=1286181 RepID=A0A7I7S476_9MYCO|nr:hypothetical protein [Mycolicibacterium arabiense]MCV7372532.1 hypothetical protein [Mycolicibacterium arabiense]BBY51658.1 hypothetical protein MARA_51260 [Mycolicibacterium arabiense]
MTTATRYFLPLVAAAGAVVAVAFSPVAAAEPTCQTTPGGTYTGTGITQCQSPGNVQINATAPAPAYPYPWDDEFYGPALIIGGGSWGNHGAGGGGHR